MMKSYVWIRTVCLVTGGLALAPAPASAQPLIEWATYAGGSDVDVAFGVDVDAQGNTYICGYTSSDNFPNATNSRSGFTDAFVAKLSPDGSDMLWSTYLGGVGDFSNAVEFATDVSVDAEGNVWVIGHTDAPDFPTVNGYQSEFGGVSDAFIVKLDPNGEIVYSSFLGGSGGENAEGFAYTRPIGEIEVADDGSIWVAGSTRSEDFPVVSPIDATFGGFNEDVFVAKFSSDGQTLEFATYLGDGFRDEPWGLELAPDGGVIIAGRAGPEFPSTAGAYSFGTPSSSGIIFVTKILEDGSALDYSIILEAGSVNIYALAVDSTGATYITGETSTGDWPTSDGAYQPQHSGGSEPFDTYVTKFSPDGSSLLASTFYGFFNANEVSRSIVVDSFDQVILATKPNVSLFPYERLLKFDAQLGSLIEDEIYSPNRTTRAMYCDSQNNIIQAGAGLIETTGGAFQEANPGGTTPFVRYLDMQDPPVLPSDLNADGAVDVFDLLILLDSWGACPACPADLDGDGIVDVFDLLMLLDAWG